MTYGHALCWAMAYLSQTFWMVERCNHRPGTPGMRHCEEMITECYGAVCRLGGHDLKSKMAQAHAKSTPRGVVSRKVLTGTIRLM
jgi:hypothetical protein